MAQRRFQRAIVIGGSMSGLLAARVLADHFEQVTIVDRDHFPSAPEFRPGVPQARHVHALLGRGNQLLEHFLPGFTEMLVDHGGQISDLIGDTRINIVGNWLPRYHSHIPAYSATRPLIEWTTRTCLTQQHANIELMPEQEVIDLLTIPTQDRVTGVRLRSRHGETLGATSEAQADLIVDASGRHSQIVTRLQAAGYPKPPVTSVDAHLGYATQLVQLPADKMPDWKTLYVMMNPPTCVRGGIMVAIEKPNTWLVTMIGAGDETPPTDEAGYLEFARRLPFSDLFDVLKVATPIAGIYGYRDTSNIRHYFERMPRFPDGLIVLGDAVCAFNPIYGQGMSVAAIDATVLDVCLKKQPGTSLTGFSRVFQGKLGKTINDPWTLSTSADFNVPGVAVSGTKPTVVTNVMNWYFGRVQHILPRSRRGYTTFARVINILTSPGALFHPAILTRALVSGGHR
jgi:2-polyprenyl-6-methoxyphenol hydroxylase-like FAD-dependent oxidoreductase